MRWAAGGAEPFGSAAAEWSPFVQINRITARLQLLICAPLSGALCKPLLPLSFGSRRIRKPCANCQLLYQLRRHLQMISHDAPPVPAAESPAPPPPHQPPCPAGTAPAQSRFGDGQRPRQQLQHAVPGPDEPQQPAHAAALMKRTSAAELRCSKHSRIVSCDHPVGAIHSMLCCSLVWVFR